MSLNLLQVYARPDEVRHALLAAHAEPALVERLFVLAERRGQQIIELRHIEERYRLLADRTDPGAKADSDSLLAAAQANIREANQQIDDTETELVQLFRRHLPSISLP